MKTYYRYSPNMSDFNFEHDTLRTMVWCSLIWWPKHETQSL